MCVLFIGFNPAILIIYTNVYVMPFVAGALLVAIKLCQKPTFGRAVAFGAIVGCGYLIKGHIIAIFIALFIVAAVYAMRDHKEQFRRTCLLCLCAVLMFGVCLLLNEGLLHAQGLYKYNPDMASPTEYWIAQGLSDGNAGYAGTYLTDTRAIGVDKTTGEQRAIYWAEIGRELRRHGLGLPIFLFWKFIVSIDVPMFGWNVIWIMVLVPACVALLLRGVPWVVKLVPLGWMGLVMILEAGWTYKIGIWPVFCLLSAITIDQILKWLQRRPKDGNI